MSRQHFWGLGKLIGMYTLYRLERNDERHYWQLDSTVYGLASWNAKFQRQMADLIYQLGLSQLSVIPHLFYVFKNEKLILVVLKVVDDLLMTGQEDEVRNACKKFNQPFELGTVTSNPEILNFYRLTITRIEDFSSAILEDKEINAIDCFPMSRIKGRQCGSSLSHIEKSSFMSVKSSLRWVCMTALPLCAFYTSYLQ